LTQPATGNSRSTGKTKRNSRKVDAAGITAPLNAAGQPISTSKNATINYEVDKTIRHTKQGMGDIRRLSAAIVVNHRKDIDKNGQPVSKPIPETEMKQINELVREAMGYNKERGDTISVANAPFTAVDKSEAELPVWKDPENISYVKDLVKYLLIAGIVAFLYLKVIQPSMKTMFPPQGCRWRAWVGRGRNFGVRRRRKWRHHGIGRRRCHPGTHRPLCSHDPEGTRACRKGSESCSQHHQGLDGRQWQLALKKASKRAPPY
jgi:hypothetical protein